MGREGSGVHVDTDPGRNSGVLTEGLIDSLFTGEVGVNGALLSFLSCVVYVDGLRRPSEDAGTSGEGRGGGSNKSSAQELMFLAAGGGLFGPL